MSDGDGGSLTPWLSDYVLEELQVEVEETDTGKEDEHTSVEGTDKVKSASLQLLPPKLVQVLNRGGRFWDSCNAADPAWIQVTDGQFSILAHLTANCRQGILASCQLTTPQASGATVFVEYSQASVGLITDYRLERLDSDDSQLPRLVLHVNQWTPKCGLNGLVVGSNTNKSRAALQANNGSSRNNLIQAITDNIQVRQALHSKVVLGNAGDVLANPEWMEEILHQATHTTQATVPNPHDSNPQLMSNPPLMSPPTPSQGNSTMDGGSHKDDDGGGGGDDDDDDDDDDDHDMINIGNMLQSTPDTNSQSTSTQQLHEVEVPATATEEPTNSQPSPVSKPGPPLPSFATPQQEITSATQNDDQDDNVEEHKGDNATQDHETMLLTQPTATIPSTTVEQYVLSPEPSHKDSSTQTPPSTRQLSSTGKSQGTTTTHNSPHTTTRKSPKRKPEQAFTPTIANSINKKLKTTQEINSSQSLDLKVPPHYTLGDGDDDTISLSTATTASRSNHLGGNNRAPHLLPQKSYWQSLQEQLDDNSMSVVRFHNTSHHDSTALTQHIKVLRRGGLFRWLHKNVV